MSKITKSIGGMAVVLAMQESDDYRDGWESAEAGLSRGSPYPVFSREYRRWCAGWDAYHNQERSL